MSVTSQNEIYCNKPTTEYRRMSSWVKEVENIMEIYGLKHLGIYAFNYESFVTSPSFKVTHAEVNNLSELMSTADTQGVYTNSRAHVSGKQYFIVGHELSDEHMKCQGPITENDANLADVVWLCKSDQYIVVAVAEKHKDNKCMDAVSELQELLLKKQQNHDD